MSCCLNGIFVPLIKDCDGTIRTLQEGERLRVGSILVGSSSNSIIYASSSQILTEDTIVLADASSSSLTVTLPTGIDGMVCSVKKIDSTTNAVVVDGDGTETLDGQLTVSTVVQHTNLTFLFYSGEWWIL